MLGAKNARYNGGAEQFRSEKIEGLCMKTKIDAFIDLQTSSLDYAIMIAEAALPALRFRAFKELILKHFHEDSKPKILAMFSDMDHVDVEFSEFSQIDEEGVMDL